ncbi:zinc-binding dehydrogenase [Streptomyces sp. CA-243310]|uniref:zinc-binding dehydrogenase n=1 Tax=Streptomyces sp. CA-243310 TaxID=3240056 RepID=UPI003D8A4F82
MTALTSGGAYAEVMLAPADLVFDAAGVDPRTAAGLGWAARTAYDLVNTVARVRAGDSVLVHAAAGSLAAQFARRAGAERSRTHPHRPAESARTALRMVASGQVSPDITAEYEMADLDEAVRRLAEGGTHGKSVLRITGSEAPALRG